MFSTGANNEGNSTFLLPFFIIINMKYTKLASAAYNDIVSGLAGFHQTPNISIEQLEDELVLQRLAIIKAYTLKGVIPKKELMVSLNCVPVDCKDIERCSCEFGLPCKGDEIAHFEMPQVNFDFDAGAIEYIGTVDRMNQFKVYTDPQSVKYHKYRKRTFNNPYVFLDYTPNENKMIDGFIFGAPLLKVISIVFIPKDLRQLEKYECCNQSDTDNFSFIDIEAKDALVAKKIQTYRQIYAPILPNTQTPK